MLLSGAPSHQPTTVCCIIQANDSRYQWGLKHEESRDEPENMRIRITIGENHWTSTQLGLHLWVLGARMLTDLGMSLACGQHQGRIAIHIRPRQGKICGFLGWNIDLIYNNSGLDDPPVIQHSYRRLPNQRSVSIKLCDFTQLCQIAWRSRIQRQRPIIKGVHAVSREWTWLSLPFRFCVTVASL